MTIAVANRISIVGIALAMSLRVPSPIPCALTVHLALMIRLHH
jgi:hypothetical protein